MPGSLRVLLPGDLAPGFALLTLSWCEHAHFLKVRVRNNNNAIEGCPLCRSGGGSVAVRPHLRSRVRVSVGRGDCSALTAALLRPLGEAKSQFISFRRPYYGARLHGLWPSPTLCRVGSEQGGSTGSGVALAEFFVSDFAGDFEDSKSTSGGTLCVFGSHTFFPISWMCKKQTSVSHSSTESEIISSDAGLRLDGIPALDLWDLIVSVLGNTTQNHDRPVVSTSEICSPPHTFHKRKQSRRVIPIFTSGSFVVCV